MLLLYQTLREAIECCPEYECINAELQDQDAVADKALTEAIDKGITIVETETWNREMVEGLRDPE